MVTFRQSQGNRLGLGILDSENVFIDDSRVNKYKDNERELKRELRYNQMQRDQENRFRKKLQDWLERERARDRAAKRELERVEQRKKDRQRLIEKDMEYDEVAERRKRKRDFKAH